MAGISGPVEIKVDLLETITRDLGSKSIQHFKKIAQAFTDGTGDDQLKKVYSDSQAATASVTYDLAGGLTDGDGSAITFTTIKLIVIAAAAANAVNVEVGANASNDFATIFGNATDKLIIPPGGTLLLMAPDDGYAVTAGTGDILKVAAASSTAAWDILLAGITA